MTFQLVKIQLVFIPVSYPPVSNFVTNWSWPFSDNQTKNGHTVSQSKYVTCWMIHNEKDAKIDSDGTEFQWTILSTSQPSGCFRLRFNGWEFWSLHSFKNLLRICPKFRSHMVTNDQIICLRHFWVWWIMKIWFSTVLIVWECQYPHWGFYNPPRC